KISKIWFVPLIFIMLLIIGVIFLGVIPARKAYVSGQEFFQTAKNLASQLKSQNLEEAKIILPKTQEQLTKLQKDWENILALKYLPIINKYHQDGAHGLKAAEYGLDTIKISLETIEPYADLLGLKGKSTFVSGSAEDRIQTAVKTLDKMTPRLADIGDKIEKLKQEVDKIDPYRYPENFRGQAVRSRLIEGKNILNDTTGLFLNARPLLEVFPQLLGEPDSKRYLILFQNDKELRPTGGFITAYAIFKIEHGKFLVEKSADIYELDGQITKKTPAPEEILTYHKGVYDFNIRDSNLSPDFYLSMKQFMELYPNKWDFDGIISVDTHVLVEAIKILGEFDIAGRKFSAETDKRCDCPRVIYELEDYATRPVAYVRDTRKDILGSLMYEIIKRALGISPSQYWGRLFQMSISEANQKHILAYMMDEKAQKGIESLNMGGRIAGDLEILGYKDSQNWDYLHINDANMAGAKSNLYVTESVKINYSFESDGSINKDITIDYKNPAPASDCNLETGGLCLNGILRNWFRVYVPVGSQLLEDKGSQSPKDGNAISLKTYDSLGKSVYEGFLTVRPHGSSQVSLKYKLPFKKSGNQLKILIQKQPGTDENEYVISVNGKQKDKFLLTADKQITLSL
ncbi:MAG: hypothetical protein UR52_C0010G0001, partial [Candidatus Gottesmanbacteria bacterium GW2011_GWA1_34_13]